MRGCPNCGRATARTADWACQWCGYPLLSRAFRKIPKTYSQIQEERRDEQVSTVIDEPQPKEAPEEKPEVELELEPELEKEPELEEEPEAISVARLEPGLERELELERQQEMGKELDKEPEVVPEPEPVPQPKPVTKSRIKRKPKPKPKARAKPKTKPKPAPIPEIEPESKPEMVSEPVPEIEPESKPEMVSEPMPEVEPESKPEMVSESVPEVEPEPVPVPGPKHKTSSGAIELTVEELNLAYQKDQVVANAKFITKILKVTGTVDKVVVKDYLDIAYVLLSGATKLEWSVRCTFEKKYSSQLNRLTQGQMVTVQGEYGGYERNIIMRDCVVVS